MGDFYRVDLAVLKLEYRQRLRMMQGASVRLVEQILVDDAQTVLGLSCKGVSYGARQRRNFFVRLTYQDINFLSSFCEVKDMKGFSVLLLRQVGRRHHHQQTRYQMSYVCVLGLQQRCSETAMKRWAFGAEHFPNV